MAKKHVRLHYEIRALRTVPGKTKLLWALFAPDGEMLTSDYNKAVLVKRAAQRLKDAWVELRVPSELVIKGRHGTRIQDKRTYGLDPRRIRG